MIRRLQNLAWLGADALRTVFDVARWPFERAAWAIERGVLWPLRARAARLGPPTWAVALSGVGVLAAGALALGIVLSGGSGGESSPIAVSPASTAAATAEPKPARESAELELEGTAPDFSPPANGSASASKVADADTVIGSDPDTTAGATVTDSAAASSSAAKEVVKDPGPAAIEVARRFSGAFVLYETGRSDARVRATIGETASPQLTKALLRRPPRQPSDVEVPKAKVLNVVPGPRHGDTFTLSASLLRVGVTSELRIDVQRDSESGQWQVTDVLG